MVSWRTWHCFRKVLNVQVECSAKQHWLSRKSDVNFNPHTELHLFAYARGMLFLFAVLANKCGNYPPMLFVHQVWVWEGGSNVISLLYAETARKQKTARVTVSTHWCKGDGGG